MSALEGHSGDSPPRGELSAVGAGGAAAGAAVWICCWKEEKPRTVIV